MHRTRVNSVQQQDAGSRFVFSVVLVVMGLLWRTTDLEAWAVVLCWLSIFVGGVLAFYFGWRYLSEARKK
jgi:hypothetical protein